MHIITPLRVLFKDVIEEIVFVLKNVINCISIKL